MRIANVVFQKLIKALRDRKKIILKTGENEWGERGRMSVRDREREWERTKTEGT